ncbi:MAG TPA: hypothetical protein VMF11_08390 [Candidatus Baltobacteraceae bacterium]|nr:hypothetical protein [Candidatus Baltobacteraceae bacterium]
MDRLLLEKLLPNQDDVSLAAIEQAVTSYDEAVAAIGEVQYVSVTQPIANADVTYGAPSFVPPAMVQYS